MAASRKKKSAAASAAAGGVTALALLRCGAGSVSSSGFVTPDAPIPLLQQQYRAVAAVAPVRQSLLVQSQGATADSRDLAVGRSAACCVAAGALLLAVQQRRRSSRRRFCGSGSCSSSSSSVAVLLPRVARLARSAPQEQSWTEDAGKTAAAAALAVSAAAFLASHPAFAQEVQDVLSSAAETMAQGADINDEAAADAAAEAADELISSSTDSGDWFEPLIKFNAGIIAGIDDTVQDTLKIPNSFGFAIIFYTALIKLVTFPLNQSSLRTNAIMMLIKPKIDQIQKKYKNDQETQNRMTLRLYDDCGVNPLGGCFPSLIQAPIFIGLYRSIVKLAEINPKFQEPFLWIPSLAGPVDSGKPSLDWLLVSKLQDSWEPEMGRQNAIAYCILPFLLVVSQFITTKISNPTVGDQGGPAGFVTNFFPLFIGYTTLVSPAGMGLYWLSNNLLTTAQTFYIRSQIASEFPEYADIINNPGKKQIGDKEKEEAKIEEPEKLTGPGVGFGTMISKKETEVEEDEEEVPDEQAKDELFSKKSFARARSAERTEKTSDADYKRKAKKMARRRR
eukprot:TRINITY_DN87721_c0_g1_i1.p1 TRINITY_DN87721_c0_g1~~TRINITY_DN87721_c0_g1_i1.p1  ORF type:complete len:563 (+),score=138.53 TRINITY_DN87721_c0_g1_i1:70-1758(+)